MLCPTPYSTHARAPSLRNKFNHRSMPPHQLQFCHCAERFCRHGLHFSAPYACCLLLEGWCVWRARFTRRLQQQPHRTPVRDGFNLTPFKAKDSSYLTEIDPYGTLVAGGGGAGFFQHHDRVQTFLNTDTRFASGKLHATELPKVCSVFHRNTREGGGNLIGHLACKHSLDTTATACGSRVKFRKGPHGGRLLRFLNACVCVQRQRNS